MMEYDLSVSDRAARLHREAFVIDTHADTPTEFFLRPGYDFGERHVEGHLDLPRLREGGVDLQFLISWVPEEVAAVEGASFDHAVRLIHAIHEVVGRARGVRVARSVAEIDGAREAGEVAILIGVEGGHAIENSLERLRDLHALGARSLTLTWNNSNDWADASGVPPRHDGLTDFGREVVRTLNRLHMLVDVSHAAESTFFDVLETSEAPVIASHSCARALADHHRNLTDEQLRSLAAQGGVVGINFFPTFLDYEYGVAFERIEADAEALAARLLENYGDEERAREEARSWRDARLAELPPVPVQAVADHIDHVVQVAGSGAVGLGSDFDGIATVPRGLPDVSAVPRITELLLRRGYDDDTIRAILGGNFARVIRQVLP